MRPTLGRTFFSYKTKPDFSCFQSYPLRKKAVLRLPSDQTPLAVIAEDIYRTLSNTVITPPGEEDIPTPTMDLPEKDTFLTNMEQLLVGETLRINTVHKNDQHYALIEKVDDNHILFFNGPYSKSSYKTKDIDETDNYILAVETIQFLSDSLANFQSVAQTVPDSRGSTGIYQNLSDEEKPLYRTGFPAKNRSGFEPVVPQTDENPGNPGRPSGTEYTGIVFATA